MISSFVGRGVGVVSLAIALLSVGCSAGDEECFDPETPGCMIASDRQRITSPSVTQAQIDAAVEANNAFAVNLYGTLRSEPGNLFYSPFSITQALAMTWAGARGDTEAQMASALGITLPQSEEHAALNAIDLALASRARGADPKVRLSVANAVWGQLGKRFEAPFLDTLAEHYGTGMHVLDYQEDPGGSREIINGWVEKRTEGKIVDLFPKDAISVDTKLVLSNAVYFKGEWSEKFEPEDTKPGVFHDRSGVAVPAKMMNAVVFGAYAEGDGWAAAEMPYRGGEVAMVIVLPAEGTFDAFEAELSPSLVAGILGSLSPAGVGISLPKAHIESSFSLGKQLQMLGMVDAFGPDADFSGMDGARELLLGVVVHKAFVNIDEEGTEAAAATGAEFHATSAVIPGASLIVDRPYLIFLRDVPTKTILFAGRVVSL